MRTKNRSGGAHVRRNNVSTDRNWDDDRPVIDTRDRFGGLDLPAAFAGTMAALGMLAVLGAIAGAWSSAYGDNLSSAEVVSATGVIAALAIIVLSAMFGGWVTGRAARYNGSGNGLLTGVLLVLLGVGLSWLIGSQAEQSGNLSMPDWITQDTTSNEALMTAGLAALVALLSAALGGSLGSFWHRRVDRSLVTETENNAFAPYPEESRLVTAPTVDETGIDDEVDNDEPVTSKRISD